MAASQIWSFVLSNGMPANAGLVSSLDATRQLLADPLSFDALLETPFTAGDLLRISHAVAAGKSTVTSHGNGAATVEFRDPQSGDLRVSADMQGSERETVALTP